MITFTTEEVESTPHQDGQTKTQETKRTPPTVKANDRIISEKARMYQNHSYTKSHILLEGQVLLYKEQAIM